MDVGIAPRRSTQGSGEPHEYGATLRFYDETIDAWRSTWIGPVRHLVRPFLAREVHDAIVLEGGLCSRRRNKVDFLKGCRKQFLVPPFSTVSREDLKTGCAGSDLDRSMGVGLGGNVRALTSAGGVVAARDGARPLRAKGPRISV